MERGFKSWCENISIRVRQGLELLPSDPLDLWSLAKSLEVEVWIPNQIPGLEQKYLHRLLREDPDSWSAVTISVPGKDLILLNSSHSPARQASDMMHELSHILAGHEPARVDITQDGLLMLNNFNRNQEDEARWLSGCLLLPREALFLIRQQRKELAHAAREYGVSVDMVRYRLNVAGIDRQLGQFKKKNLLRAGR